MNRIAFVIPLVLGAWSLELCSAPLHPANPYPADLAVNVPANADLTWTPGDMELIRNGGFEITNFTGWVRFNNNGGGGGGANNNTYINDGIRRPFNGDVAYPPYAGNYSAVTDMDGPGLISIYQDVVVPAGVGSVQLTWADQIHNYFNTFVAEEPPQRQEYRVELRNAANNVLTTIYRTEPGDPVWTAWNKRAFDLTPYKGQTLRIAFVQEQWRNFFHMFYDNISVRVQNTGPVTYDVFFGTNAVPGTNQFRGNVAAGSFPLPQLLPQTTYFWRVDARFGTNVFAGPVWRFTTAPIGPVDHFTWEPILSTQSPAIPFNVSITARDAFENVVTNFSGTATLTARIVQDIEPQTLYQFHSVPSTAYVAMENTTVAYSFTPHTDLIAFTTMPKGRLWTEDGILLDPYLPAHLQAGKTYRYGMYSPGTVTNYLDFEGPSTFPHGTINQAYEGTGDAFPTRPHPARWWHLAMTYMATTLSPSMLSQSLQFTSGAWNGPISIPFEGKIQLTTADSSGANGKANLFLVADEMRLEILQSHAGGATLRFNSIFDVSYSIQRSHDLNTWVPLITIHGTGGVIERTFSLDDSPAFFRLAR